MLGFSPIDGSAATGVEASLSEVNARLAAYKEAWDSAVDSWLVIKIGDPQVSNHMHRMTMWGFGGRGKERGQVDVRGQNVEAREKSQRVWLAPRAIGKGTDVCLVQGRNKGLQVQVSTGHGSPMQTQNACESHNQNLSTLRLTCLPGDYGSSHAYILHSASHTHVTHTHTHTSLRHP